MSYFLAASLAALRAQANERWPDRDKASDGWIGDTSHQARPSDHNPDWSKEAKARGVYGIVRAYDIDEDLDGNTADNGAELRWWVDWLVATRDPRIAYLIYEGQICSSTVSPWTWRPYGQHPHSGHVHVSIRHTAAAENDTRPWFPTLEEDPLSALSHDEQRELLRLARTIAPATAGDGRLKEVTLAVRALLGVDAGQQVTEAVATGEGRQAFKTLIQGAVLDGLRERTDQRPDRGVLRAEVLSIIDEALDRRARSVDDT